MKEEKERQALGLRFEAVMLEWMCTSGGKSEALKEGMLELRHRFENVLLEFECRVCSGHISLVSRNFSNEEGGNTTDVCTEGMQDCRSYVCFAVVPLTAFLVFCRFGNNRGNYAKEVVQMECIRFGIVPPLLALVAT